MDIIQKLTKKSKCRQKCSRKRYTNPLLIEIQTSTIIKDDSLQILRRSKNNPTSQEFTHKIKQEVSMQQLSVYPCILQFSSQYLRCRINPMSINKCVCVHVHTHTNTHNLYTCVYTQKYLTLYVYLTSHTHQIEAYYLAIKKLKFCIS